MPKHNLDINKFSFVQMVNDSKGKTSNLLFCGLMSVLVGLGGFFGSGITILTMVIFKLDKDVNVISFLNMLVMQSLALVTVGGGMLGYQRGTNDKEIKIESEQSEEKIV